MSIASYGKRSTMPANHWAGVGPLGWMQSPGEASMNIAYQNRAGFSKVWLTLLVGGIAAATCGCSEEGRLAEQSAATVPKSASAGNKPRSGSQRELASNPMLKTGRESQTSSSESAVGRQPGDVRVFYFRDNAPKDISSAFERVDRNAVRQFTQLPLILKQPARVQIEDRIYHVDQEGMYRFLDFRTRQTRNVILYLGDMWRFAGHVSRLQVHGWRHDNQNDAELTETARIGRLSITCGIIARFARHHLEQQGYKTRGVSTKTLDEWDSYDNGHILMEVFDPHEQRWVLFDPDMGCRLLNRGRALNLGEVVQLYKSGQKGELNFLSYPAIDTHAETTAPKDHAQFTLYGDIMLRYPEMRQSWYRHVFQVPLIDGAYPLSREDESRLAGRSLSGKRMTWDEWMRRSYSIAPTD
jgi:hypothetical protein